MKRPTELFRCRARERRRRQERILATRETQASAKFAAYIQLFRSVGLA